MVSVDSFRSFLGLNMRGQRAVGLIKITPTQSASDPDRRPLDIPQEARFFSNNQAFFPPDPAELSESADFVIVALQSINLSSDANIPANADWTTNLKGKITLSNDAPFSGGQTETPGQYPRGIQKTGLSEAELQASIDVARAQLRKLLGLEKTDNLDETDPLVRQAICIYGMWFLECNTINELSYTVPLSSGTSPQKTKYFRERLFKAVITQVLSLCGHLRKVKRFMPDPSSEGGAS